MARELPVSPAEYDLLVKAYEVLGRVGRGTAQDGEWDYSIDQAHHALGFLLAHVAAGGMVLRPPD